MTTRPAEAPHTGAAGGVRDGVRQREQCRGPAPDREDDHVGGRPPRRSVGQREATALHRVPVEDLGGHHRAGGEGDAAEPGQGLRLARARTLRERGPPAGASGRRIQQGDAPLGDAAGAVAGVAQHQAVDGAGVDPLRPADALGVRGVGRQRPHRRPVAGAGAVQPAYLRQMAAYRDALRVIFPGRRVEAALLYTAAPRLIVLDNALLDTHKPGLAATKANLPGSALEPDAPTP